MSSRQALGDMKRATCGLMRHGLLLLLLDRLLLSLELILLSLKLCKNSGSLLSLASLILPHPLKYGK